MPDLFTLTILFLVISTVVAAFISGRRRDKCLKGFSKNSVILKFKNNQTLEGTLLVEPTGMELVYPSTAFSKEQGGSYIIYKNEYADIGVIIRIITKLNDIQKKKRERDYKKTYHPSYFRRMRRRIRNLFATVQDTINEAISLFIGRLGSKGVGGGVISSQQKYIGKMQQELTGSLNRSFEPLMEKYIGHRVIVTIKKGDNIETLSGVLKEYTALFLTLLDIEQSDEYKDSDIILPRDSSIVRHAGEPDRETKL